MGRLQDGVRRTAPSDRASGGTCRRRSRDSGSSRAQTSRRNPVAVTVQSRAAWRASLRCELASVASSEPRTSLRCGRAGWCRACRPRLRASCARLPRSLRTGPSICASASPSAVGRFEHAGIERDGCRIPGRSPVIAGGARPHLLAHQGEEVLGRPEHGAVGQPRLPAGRRAAAARARRSRRRACCAASRIVAQQVPEPRSSPRARLPRRPSAPSSQRRRSAASRRSDARRRRRRRRRTDDGPRRTRSAVGRVPSSSPPHRRLDHDQRMVGDRRCRLARARRIAALDEALAVVRAGRIDAFAAPVGEVA